MNMHLTNTRNLLVDNFYALQTYARRDLLFAKLTGKSTSLTTFPDQVSHKSPNRKFIATQDIPIEQIVGTLNRQSDFDHKFRPLKSSLRDRWINVYQTLQNSGWAPILVHKVGDQYFVEDGHHRVSVARALGMKTIEANVWEHSVQTASVKKCRSTACLERSSVSAYAAD